ncbi:hypothetical protein T492DRAFT_1098208 [Pavlovales sp. CCMP2436]|nr:hypothetical protein T492DRAFT_1098208 [Pavlovales sp. CCMP2436]
MRFLLLAALCAASAGAFSVPVARSRPLPAVAVRSQLRSSSRRVAVVALVGDDKFVEAAMDADSVGGKLGSPIGKVAMQSLVAVSALAGFAVAPSVRPVVKGVFAVATAAGGFVARKRLVKLRRSAATAVLAKLFSDKGVANVGLEEAWQLAKDYGVTEEDFAAQLAELLGVYFGACIRKSATKTTELSDLLAMRRSFKLGFDVTGDAVYEVATRFYSESRAYFQAEEEHDSKQKLDKLVFLADRLLAEDPSEEGFRYERLRICKKFGFDDKEWQRRVEKVGAPFFKDLLLTVAKNPASATEADITAMGKQLGLAPETIARMKLEELRRSVAAALEASGAKFTSSQLEKIKSMGTSLGLSEEEYRGVIEAAVGPAYSAALADVLAELESASTDVSAKVLGKLAVRQQELDISATGATNLELASVRARIASQVKAALGKVRFQDMPGASAKLRECVTFAERLVAMARASGKAGDADDAAVLNGYLDAGSRAASPLESVQLYRIFCQSCLEGEKLQPTDAPTLRTLALILGISEGQRKQAFDESAAPIYTGKLRDATAGDSFAPGLAAELRALGDALGLDVAATVRARAAAYRARLVERAGEGKVPSESDDAMLATLIAALELGDLDIEGIQIEVCSPSYSAAVKEVMGSSGVIGEENWAGLEKLQSRLRLPDEVAEELYLDEARRKFLQLGKAAIEQMGEAMQKEFDAKKSGGGMGPSPRQGVVAEAAKILKFADEARLLVSVEGGAQICKINMRGAASERGIKEFYKQYLTECFSSEGEAAEKLFAQADLLAQALGLSNGEVRTIQTEFGSVLYQNVIAKALQERGNVNDDDREQMKAIQDALGMEQAVCEKLLFNVKKGRVFVMVERMFDGSMVTTSNIASVRETAEALGLDMFQDVGIPVARLLRMLRGEMETAIENGEVPPTETGRLSELQEVYGLPQELVNKELQALIERRCSGHLLQAAAALRQGKGESALAETEMLLKFNCLSPYKVISAAVMPSELEDIMIRYQAAVMKNGPLDDAGRANVDVLRTALSLGGAEVEAAKPEAPEPEVA